MIASEHVHQQKRNETTTTKTRFELLRQVQPAPSSIFSSFCNVILQLRIMDGLEDTHFSALLLLATNFYYTFYSCFKKS
jgi:hypothetical protein